ncbi:Oligopeptide ABC transporter, periplasmic oligopeptide-binding protein OppA (TC 3.A.1.5.1) [hydrothermal vent metagenome]|uniref:Oligopeptide ABC transporter, periplasmic oligopeptide-binding protein OppA (TC 3.A.1.5.1) n=1 Tax=hydrothermal vent metagenome TaxID=652676 RepID=A0A3B0S482_9ZZZZ
MSISASCQRRTFLLASGAVILAGCGRKTQSQNSLRIGIASAPDSMDPAQGQFASAALLFKQLYTPLTNYGADGGLAPGLAKSWEISEDGLRWIFTLRQGLQWSDTEPITAKDVVASTRYLLNPESTYADAGDFSLLENVEAVLAGELPVEKLGVRQISTFVVQFSFTRPLGVFAELMREFYPSPEHILAQPTSNWPNPPNFVGSGPYLLTQGTQQSMTLVRNPLAPDATNIDTVYISVVEDAATRARMVRAGDLDLVEDPPTNQIAALSTQEEVALHGWKAPRFVYLKVNHKHPALSDIRVRQALNLVVDRTFIADKLFEGAAQVANSILPDLHANSSTFPERIKQAKQLLADAGYGDGLTISLLHSGEFRERMAVVLAQNWKQIGVTCYLQASDGPGLYAFIEAGEFDLALASFDRGLKRENWRLIEPFESDGFAANFNWTNLQYDQAVAAARAEANPVKRSWYASQAADIIHEDAAIIPLIFEQKFWLANPDLNGFSDKVTPDQWRFLNWR